MTGCDDGRAAEQAALIALLRLLRAALIRLRAAAARGGGGTLILAALTASGRRRNGRGKAASAAGQQGGGADPAAGPGPDQRPETPPPDGRTVASAPESRGGDTVKVLPNKLKKNAYIPVLAAAGQSLAAAGALAASAAGVMGGLALAAGATQEPARPPGAPRRNRPAGSAPSAAAMALEDDPGAERAAWSAPGLAGDFPGGVSPVAPGPLAGAAGAGLPPEGLSAAALFHGLRALRRHRLAAGADRPPLSQGGADFGLALARQPQSLAAGLTAERNPAAAAGISIGSISVQADGGDARAQGQAVGAALKHYLTVAQVNQGQM